MPEDSIDVDADVIEPAAPAEEKPAEIDADESEAEADGPKSLDEPETEETDDGEGDGEDGEDDEAVEMREFDFGGNKLAVPKDSVPPELADKIDEFTKGTWSDYTRKAQANAETAKALQARESAVAKLTTLNGETLQTYTKGLQLRSEIEQLSQVDLNEMWQSNPDQARRVSDALAHKQAEFQNVVAIVGQHEQALDAAQQSEIVRRSEEGKAVLNSYVKDFSKKIAPDVVDYVVQDGMPKAEAEKWALNPTMAKYAHKAMLYDRMQATASKPKPNQSPATPLKAIKTKGAATGSRTSPDNMSVEQMRKHLGIAS